MLDWQKRKMFNELLKRMSSYSYAHSPEDLTTSVEWSDELYPVYVHPPLQPTTSHDPIAFAIERAAVPLFGLVNFGCLLTGKKLSF